MLVTPLQQKTEMYESMWLMGPGALTHFRSFKTERLTQKSRWTAPEEWHQKVASDHYFMHIF